MGVDTLFVHPGNHSACYQELAREFTAVDAPVWTCLLAQYLRNRGLSVAIHDVNVQGWDTHILDRLVERFQPSLIVSMVYGHHPSASTQTMPAAAAILGDIKKQYPDIPLAIGGTHPSSLPIDTLNEVPADFVVQGEGAIVIERLIHEIRHGRSFGNVQGLAFRRTSGQLCVNPPAKVVESLDTDLTGYAWDLLPPMSSYRAHNWHCFQDFQQSSSSDFSDVRTPYVSLYGSLGCPFNCSYCCINALYGKPSIRYWSPETIIGWIDTLVNAHGVRNIRFADELFILSPQRVERLCDMIIERQYDLNIWVYARVDTVKDSLLGKLKRAGVNWISLGIESANPQVRSGVNKTIRGDIREMVRTIQASGIYIMGNFMFGLPDDTLQTMEETLQLALDLRCEFINFYSVMAYPGSSLFETVKNGAGYLPETWAGYSQLGYHARPLPTKHVPASRVLAFRDEAFVRYVTDQRYRSFVQERFGGKVVSHIDKITAVSLKRKLLEDEPTSQLL